MLLKLDSVTHAVLGGMVQLRGEQLYALLQWFLRASMQGVLKQGILHHKHAHLAVKPSLAMQLIRLWLA